MRADAAVAPLGLRRQAAPGVQGFPRVNADQLPGRSRAALESAPLCAALG